MHGCAQGLAIPAPLKELYKTVWEIKQRILVDMAADRGAFIDQSQSFNVHMSDPNFGKLTSLHFYAWKARAPAFYLPFEVLHPFAMQLVALSRWPCLNYATLKFTACGQVQRQAFEHDGLAAAADHR